MKSTASYGITAYVIKVFLAIFALVVAGCATPATMPVTIKHQSTPSQSEAAVARDRQYQREPVDQNAAAARADKSEIITPLSGDPVVPAEQYLKIPADEGAGEATTGKPESASSPRDDATVAPQSRREATGQNAGDAVAAGPQNLKEPVDQNLAALVDLLKKKNLISEEEAARLTAQVAARSAQEKVSVIAAATNDRQRVEELSQSIANEKKQVEELNQSVSHVTQKVADLYSGKAAELAAVVPESSKRVRFSGDIRLRYEHDFFNKDNAEIYALPVVTNPPQIANTHVDQDRFKYRVRANVTAKVNDQVEVAASLSTGNTTNPVSTNSIMGDFMNKDNILFDQAYLKWRPLDGLTMYGGRMPNPWFSTDLVWDTDLNFEGLALNFKAPVTDSLTPFMTVGAFPLQQSDPAGIFDSSQHAKWLVGGQLGVENKNRGGIGYKLGAAYYRFSNITGVLNNDPVGHPGATDWSVPLFMQKGNTIFNISGDPNVAKAAYAAEFKEFNLTGTLDIGFWDPVHVVLRGDFVKNLGFNKSDVKQRTGLADIDENTLGYQIGLSVGYPVIQDFGQWRASLSHKYLGGDAVVDAYTDSDFHLGGTNAKGWTLGADFGLSKNYWIGFKWMTANEIGGLPLKIDVLQFDLNARF